MIRRLLLLYLGWMLIPISVHADQPPPALILIDPLYLTKIEGASIQVFAGDRLLMQGQSDEEGKVTLRHDLPDSCFLLIAHPAYDRRQLALADVIEQEYQVYLSLRSYETETVLLSAGRQVSSQHLVPHRVEVHTARDVQFQNPQHTGDLLSQSGQVFVQKSQLGGGSPNLRGFEANKVLLVVDGVRMNNTIYRSGHLQNLLTMDVDILDRVEVLFGPGAVVYGSDALGGVIHLLTQAPQLSQTGRFETTQRTALRYSSANQERTLHSDVNFGGKRWASLTSITASDFGDLRSGSWRPQYPNWGIRDSFVIRENGQDIVQANPDPTVQTPSSYQQLHLLHKLIWVPNSTQTHLLNFQYATSSDVPRYDRLTQMRNGRLRYAEWSYGPQERIMMSYRLRHRPQRGWYDELTLIPAYQYVEESRLDRLRGEDWREEQIEQVKIASLNLDISRQLTPQHQLRLGAEGFANWVSSQATAYNILTEATRPIQSRYPAGGTNAVSAALYLTHQWAIRPRLQAQAGVRLTGLWLQAQLGDELLLPLPFSEIIQRNLAPSANLSLTWQPSSNWQLGWMGGTGFRAPNLDDLAKVFDSQPGNVIVPNPSLAPEYTYHQELTLRRQWGNALTLKANGYLTYYDQAIVVRPFHGYGADSILYDGQLSLVQANVNAQSAWLTGGHISLSGQWGHWQSSVGATYTYGIIPASQTYLDHIPPLFGWWRGGYQGESWRIEMALHWQGWKRLQAERAQGPSDDPRDLANQVFATPEGWPAWWRMDLKAAYTGWEWLDVQMGVDNLLDLHYRPYSSRISAPGRNVYLAVKRGF